MATEHEDDIAAFGLRSRDPVDKLRRGPLLSRGVEMGLGFAGMVSVGNEFDISLGEVCASAVDDPAPSRAGLRPSLFWRPPTETHRLPFVREARAREVRCAWPDRAHAGSQNRGLQRSRDTL